jgi:hypothetical protein
MYDIIYYKQGKSSDAYIDELRQHFPIVNVVEGTEPISRKVAQQLLVHSKTGGAWVIAGCPHELLNFDLSFVAPIWDHRYIHVLPIRPVKGDFAALVFENRIQGKKIIENSLLEDFQGYDIFFISYNEPYADDNFRRLKERFQRVKRIHGIDGIHNAHREAARLSETNMFYVVDGDAVIVDGFKFDYVPEHLDMVYVWRSINPLTDDQYGYGGVKLLPKYLTMDMKMSGVDMTTSISRKFCAVDDVSNITAFNSDPFSTWRSAFRECVKLSSRVIKGQVDTESEKRLESWCNISDDRLYGIYGRLGAIAGRKFGDANRGKKTSLKLINDFTWLKEEFQRQLFKGG